MLRPPVARGGIGLEATGLTVRFGDNLALDNVSLRVRAGTLHALLGENGAGKTTLAKCIIGVQEPHAGQIFAGGHVLRIGDARHAAKTGLGMVYQHFTLVPSLTGAENLVVATPEAPAIINLKSAYQGLAHFMQSMPFKVPLDQLVAALSAGEKQKLEVLKQLWLGRRFLILDEPSSVLSPSEADDMLSYLRALCDAGDVSVLLITHKFREIERFADEVSVLRRGRNAGGGLARDLTRARLAELMVGTEVVPSRTPRIGHAGAPVLRIARLKAAKSGRSLEIARLQVHEREIVGIAGVSGNGQALLMDVLTGGQAATFGKIHVKNAVWNATRRAAQELNVRFLPEDPMRNACAASMSVAENLMFRVFDTDGKTPRFWLRSAALRGYANQLARDFAVRGAALDAPLSALSGGNIQRLALAREMSGDVDLLVIANPCFGLDFVAVNNIRGRIMAARNAGAAILLLSEDLDEIMELSDRVLVMSDGRLTYEAPIAEASLASIGHHMGGGA